MTLILVLKYVLGGLLAVGILLVFYWWVRPEDAPAWYPLKRPLEGPPNSDK